MNVVGIVARFPPPLGGVSVYADRRLNQSIDNEVTKKIDLGSFSSILNLIFGNFSIYEVHSLNIKLVLFLTLFGKSKRCIFYDHNASRHFSGMKKKLLLYFLKGSFGIKVVNEKLISFYSPIKEAVNVEVFIPFIPPRIADEEKIIETYDKDVRSFVDNGSFWINSAWRYIPCSNGLDLYGISTSLELLSVYRSERLLLAIPEYESEKLPSNVLNMIKSFQKQGRLCLLVGQKQLWPLFRHAKLFFRLTSTDGDSVSVREALFLGCSVIASDVVVRPDGVETYQYNSFDDLVRCINLAK
ncbi:hypothetical protein [Endozoicomonas sp. ALD040]|uniref:hypothetical protein n=1 Tax=unclassified Endozoicomonas TaxID=2644528 RepID=UPI003BAF171C